MVHRISQDRFQHKILKNPVNHVYFYRLKAELQTAYRPSSAS